MTHCDDIVKRGEEKNAVYRQPLPGTGTLPVWGLGAKRPNRRRHGLLLTKQLKCRTSPAVSGSGGVDREVNSPARAEGGASPIPGND